MLNHTPTKDLKINEDIMEYKLEFYTSVGLIDIWSELDTKNGKTKYSFWHGNKTYESENPAKIIFMAHQLATKQKTR